MDPLADGCEVVAGLVLDGGVRQLRQPQLRVLQRVLHLGPLVHLVQERQLEALLHLVVNIWTCLTVDGLVPLIGNLPAL